MHTIIHFFLILDESEDDDEVVPSRRRRLAERAAEGVTADEEVNVLKNCVNICIASSYGRG